MFGLHPATFSCTPERPEGEKGKRLLEERDEKLKCVKFWGDTKGMSEIAGDNCCYTSAELIITDELCRETCVVRWRSTNVWSSTFWLSTLGASNGKIHILEKKKKILITHLANMQVHIQNHYTQFSQEELESLILLKKTKDTFWVW